MPIALTLALASLGRLSCIPLNGVELSNVMLP